MKTIRDYLGGPFGRSATITKDTSCGPINQKEAEETLKKLNYSQNPVIDEAYKIMGEMNIRGIEISSLPLNIDVFADNYGHPLGELILEKDKGFVTQLYNGDCGATFTSKTIATEIKVFGLNYEEIILKIKKWNESPNKTYWKGPDWD
jgi:hypothetical protein